MQETDLPLGVSVSGTSQAETIDLALTLGLFDAVQATWNLHERAAEDALAPRARRGPARVRQGGAGQRPRSRDRDAEALAAALAQPWATVVLSGAASVDVLRSNLRARDTAPPDARRARGQRRLLGAPRVAGLELSVTVTRAPPAGRFAASTSPPWARTSRRAIASPSPAPPPPRALSPR